jgi:xanthine/uracil/vitamin C permease (AzgA family)
VRRGTDLRTEAVGGATTFVALSYIVFVPPAVLYFFVAVFLARYALLAR